MEPKSFVMACLDFFGRKLNETIVEFKAEINALTPKDREELTAMLNAAGHPVKA